MLKYDFSENKITISVPKTTSQESFIEELPSSIDEGEFFQSTLIHDYHIVTFEHINFIREAMNIVESKTDTSK